MLTYLKRMAEQVVVVFFAAAVPVLATEGLSKAALFGALAAGLRALYGMVVKPAGDTESPNAAK